MKGEFVPEKSWIKYIATSNIMLRLAKAGNGVTFALNDLILITCGRVCPREMTSFHGIPTYGR